MTLSIIQLHRHLRTVTANPLRSWTVSPGAAAIHGHVNQRVNSPRPTIRTAPPTVIASISAGVPTAVARIVNSRPTFSPWAIVNFLTADYPTMAQQMGSDHAGSPTTASVFGHMVIRVEHTRGVVVANTGEANDSNEVRLIRVADPTKRRKVRFDGRDERGVEAVPRESRPRSETPRVGCPTVGGW